MKYALVTGGSRGIGRAVSCKLAEMGYFILINYQNNDAEAEKTLQLVQEKGSNGELMKFDVTDPAAITLALGNWASQHPDEYIEVLINNAGIRKDNLMLWMTGEEWSKVLDISLNGFFNVTQPLLKNMLVKRYGRIVNIVSLSGIQGMPGQANYSAAKGGVIAATKALAQEVAKKKVTVTVADGRFWYSLGNGLGNGQDNNWYLDGNGASVVSSDGKKTIVQMGSGYRGDLWLARSGKGKVVNVTPADYRYFAIKVGFKSQLVPGKNKPNGCIKLEIFDDGIKKIGPEYFGTGGDANNRYEILGASEISTTEPNVLYYDLQSKYKTVTPTDWNQVFDLAQCKFVIADFPETAQTYDLYWIRSFKSIEELQAFVDSENNTNE